MSRNLQMFDNFRPIRSRPGSVDLFEHDAKEAKAHITNPHLNFLRSKSSLEINTSPDNYFYSEANYAAKMRQSAHYLQNTTPKKGVDHTIKGTGSNTIKRHNPHSKKNIFSCRSISKADHKCYGKTPNAQQNA